MILPDYLADTIRDVPISAMESTFINKYRDLIANGAKCPALISEVCGLSPAADPVVLQRKIFSPPETVPDPLLENGFQETKVVFLLDTDFPSLHWSIQDMLPSGTLLLSGKPKKGKSFLSLMIALCVAAGRPVFGKETSKRPVLYLGLEDSERRLKTRTIACMNALGIMKTDIENLSVTISCATIDEGLIDQLHDRMRRAPETGLVIVDMLKKITAKKKLTKDLYQEQALVGEALTAFCHKYPNLSIIVVHHNNKGSAEDPFDQLSGTTGLAGSYDALAVIVERDGDRTLHVTGRDIEGAEIPLLMNARGMYTLEIPTEEEIATHGMSGTRRAVYDAVPAGVPYSRAEIIKGCGYPETAVDQQLRLLVKAGLINKLGRGEYQRTGKRFFDNAFKETTF